MYSDVWTQLYTWAHYALAFAGLFVFAPVALFRKSGGTLVDRLLANYVRMVLFIICIGYALVALKLFEVIGIVVCILAFASVRKRREGAVATSYGVALLFDVLEFPRRIPHAIHAGYQWASRVGRGRKNNFRTQLTLQHVRIFVAVLVLGTACAIRLYDAILVAAPEQSDGDVTLAWMKYVNERFLFHDGIYPQGLYMYMATLSKFAVINPLFILKFTGPINTCLTVILLFFFLRQLGVPVSRSATTIGAIVGACMYGVLGEYLLREDWTRVAASNSQEFGFLFVFPAVYYLYQYFQEKKPISLMVSFASLCDAGLIHSLSYELAFLAAVSLVTAVAIANFRAEFRNIIHACVAILISGIVSVLPIGLGYVVGARFNSSATTFLTSSATRISFPSLSFFDIAAIIGIVALIIHSFWEQINHRQALATLSVGIWGLLCFLVYEFGGVLTHSGVLSSRMLDLWAITESVVVGLGVTLGGRLFTRLRKWNRIEVFGWCALIGAIVLFAPPKVVIPYTVQWDDDVNAYLKINNEFRLADGGYMIVAQNFEYALVLGDGYRMDPHQFLTTYDPTKPPLTRYGQSHPDKTIASHVFLYVYKRIFEVPKSNSIYPLELPMYQDELRNKPLYLTWLEKFRQANGPSSVQLYYNGPHLDVYEITVR